MSQSAFLKPTDQYQRDINPIGHYVEQAAYFLSKMTGDPIEKCEAFIRKGFQDKSFPGMCDPIVDFNERGDNGDIAKNKEYLSQYLNTIIEEEYILAPTGTVYLPTKKATSILSTFMTTNVRLRSIAKKEAAAAKARGERNLAIFKSNEEKNKKLYNNSCSGAFCTAGSVLHNPTAHSTLTSITRTVSSFGNASNERVIAGNRHYWSPDTVINNLISISSGVNESEIMGVVQKYRLVIPTIDDVITCITYSSDHYWRDSRAIEQIRLFVLKMTDVERVAFVYGGDLYHIRLHNPEFIRSLLTEMSRKITAEVKEPLAVIKTIPESTMNYAHLICMAEVKGKGKNYEEMVKLGILNTLIPTAQHIDEVIDKHRDFLEALFLTKNIPASIAYIPSMIRKTVVLSDTDSTMFSVDEWVSWYFGDLVFNDASYALAGAVMYIATETIAHSLATVSANMGFARDKIHTLAMKPEFLFPVFAGTSVAKHYFTEILMKEGSVYEETEMEIKGVHLRSSSAPPCITRAAAVKMKEILATIRNNQKISLVAFLKEVADLEREITRSVLAGEPTYYRQSKIKDKDAYSGPPEVSPYQHYVFWKTVFEPKYGPIDQPPYSVFKIPLTTDNPTKLKLWLGSIVDPDMRGRLMNWFARNGKRDFGTAYISIDYMLGFGIPEELRSIVDSRRMVMDMTNIYRIMAESLGYFIKDGWLLSELGF